MLRFRTCIDESSSVSEVKNTVREYHLPEKFFMVCNQFWQHKNHLRVLESLSSLRKRGVEIHIVMTGHLHDYRRPQFQDEILQAIHRQGIHANVFLLGRIPKRDYFRLMRAAVAVLQPSLFEGWSSVVEDARAMGKTIVLSDIPVHREQNPPGAYYFNPHSSSELADVMHSVRERIAPGPDLEAESAAKKNSRKEIREFAETFCRIAVEAHKTQMAGT
jgi:glycosyltransferase involved in cell wall biosynthesis